MERRFFLKFLLVLLPSNNVYSKKLIYSAKTSFSYYGVFFDVKKNNQICFTTSNDLQRWSAPLYLNYGENPLSGRDPSIIYYNGKWLLALTGSVDDEYDVSLFSSNDLKHWKPQKIKLGGARSISSKKKLWGDATILSKYIWAPEFVLDRDSKLYLAVSVLMGKDQGSKHKDNYFEIYISSVEDKNGTFAFSVAKKITITDSNGIKGFYSHIDPFIIFDIENGSYILSAKRENYAIIDFFRAESIDGDYSYIGTLDLHYIHKRMDVEGPSIVYKTGVWYVYFDSYFLGQGILYVTTKNFIKFSEPKKMDINEFTSFRHGTIRVL